MGKVTGLGHVGVYAQDLPKLVEFYTNVMGMTVTDQAPDGRIVFLSAQPESEHHELVFARSEDQSTTAGQISFHVDTLADLKEIHNKLIAAGCKSERVVNHGIAFGSYFRDPEENMMEIYWSTGLDYPQPMAEPIDLSQDDETLLRLIEELPPRPASKPHMYGKDTGKRVLESAN